MTGILFDILSNPDSKTYSSKRVGGFISLLATICFGFLDLGEPMLVMAGLVISFFGLSTIDYKAYLKQDNSPTNEGETPVNP